MASPVELKAKKTCCQSNPRCKRCPVVLRRLERRGLAERLSKRRYALTRKPKKKELKKARAR
jgi:hypothetical protein